MITSQFINCAQLDGNSTHVTRKIPQEPSLNKFMNSRPHIIVFVHTCTCVIARRRGTHIVQHATERHRSVDHRNKRVPSTWRPFSQEPIAAIFPTQHDICILLKPRNEPKSLTITDVSNCLKCHLPIRQHLHPGHHSTLETEIEPRNQSPKT